MKLSDYARKNSVTYRTAYRWFRDNQIEDAYQTPSGTIIIPDEEISGQRRGKRKTEQLTTDLQDDTSRFIPVNPAYTAQTCSKCGEIANPPNRIEGTRVPLPTLRNGKGSRQERGCGYAHQGRTCP